MSNSSRVKPGVPTGGQFATSPRAAATDVDLDMTPAEEGLDWEDNGYGGMYAFRDGANMSVEPVDADQPDNLQGAHQWTVCHSGAKQPLRPEAYGTASTREEAMNMAEAAGKWGTSGVGQGSRSPWGTVDDAQPIAPGITSVGTPGHGGYKLSPERNKAVHPAWRDRNGWYEEDCEWAIVATTFPDEPAFAGITERMADKDSQAAADGIPHAERVARDYYPDAYEKVTGKTILPGQSRGRDEATFRTEHANDYVVNSATISDADPTMVEVGARIGSTGEKARFTLPREEYQTRSEFGFVIDPTRHRRIDGDA